jgi:hypothetical protein
VEAYNTKFNRNLTGSLKTTSGQTGGETQRNEQVVLNFCFKSHLKVMLLQTFALHED